MIEIVLIFCWWNWHENGLWILIITSSLLLLSYNLTLDIESEILKIVYIYNIDDGSSLKDWNFRQDASYNLKVKLEKVKLKGTV